MPRRPFGFGAILAAAFINASCAAGSNGGSVDPECGGYVRCYEATGGTKGSLDSSYGSHGSCWETTTAAATACTDACKSALAALKSTYPDAGC